VAGGVDLEVIDDVPVNAFKEVLQSFPRVAVISLALAVGKRTHRAVNAHEEDVVGCKKIGDERGPVLKLDDVIDDEIIPSFGDGGEAAVKGFEEPRSHLDP
jgi:hypothetical protein